MPNALAIAFVGIALGKEATTPYPWKVTEQLVL